MAVFVHVCLSDVGNIEHGAFDCGLYCGDMGAVHGDPLGSRSFQEGEKMSCIYAIDKAEHDQVKHVFNDPDYQCSVTGNKCVYDFPSDLYCSVLREKGEKCDK